jgi:hypothetical protein
MLHLIHLMKLRRSDLGNRPTHGSLNVAELKRMMRVPFFLPLLHSLKSLSLHIQISCIQNAEVGSWMIIGTRVRAER